MHLMEPEIIGVTNVVQCGVLNEINGSLSLSIVWLGLLVQHNFSLLKDNKQNGLLYALFHSIPHWKRVRNMMYVIRVEKRLHFP